MGTVVVLIRTRSLDAGAVRQHRCVTVHHRPDLGQILFTQFNIHRRLPLGRNMLFGEADNGSGQTDNRGRHCGRSSNPHDFPLRGATQSGTDPYGKECRPAKPQRSNTLTGG